MIVACIPCSFFDKWRVRVRYVMDKWRGYRALSEARQRGFKTTDITLRHTSAPHEDFPIGFYSLYRGIPFGPILRSASSWS